MNVAQRQASSSTSGSSPHNGGNKAEWVLSGKFQTRLSPLRQMAQESMAYVLLLEFFHMICSTNQTLAVT